MTTRILYKALSILLLLTAFTSCRDDSFGSSTVDFDMPEITVTAGRFPVVRTRTAEAVDENSVREIFVAIYDKQGHIQYHSYAEVNKSGGGHFSTRIALNSAMRQFSPTNQGKIYVVANRRALIQANFPAEESTLHTILDSTPLSSESLLGMYAVKTLSSYKDIAAKSDGTPELYELLRNRAKVTVEKNESDDNPYRAELQGFTVESWALTHLPAEGYVVTGTLSEPDDADAVPSSFIDAADPLYPFPAANSGKTVLVIRGGYGSERAYFCAELKQGDDFLSLSSNTHYQILLDRAAREGYLTPEAALEGMYTAQVTIKDHQPSIFNMISDGEHELGVSDTIRYTSGHTDYDVMVKLSGHDISAAEPFEFTISEECEGWVSLAATNPDGSAKYDHVEQIDDEDGQKAYLYHFSLHISEPLDSKNREGYVDVRWGSLFRRIVVMQQPELITDLLSVTLDYGASTPISGYLNTFIKKADGQPTTSQVGGLLPAQNGGVVRNRGFHFPVGLKAAHGSDVFVKYKYTCRFQREGITGWNYTVRVTDPTLEPLIKIGNPTGTIGSSTSFTLEWAGDPASYEYLVGEHALEIVLDNSPVDTDRRLLTFVFDLYHTGFFFKYDAAAVGDRCTDASGKAPVSGWYYYEVQSVRKRDGSYRYWLDRNIGATACGVYIETAAGSLFAGTGQWPYLDSSRGGHYSVSQGKDAAGNPKMNYDGICPPGFRVPTVKEWTNLTGAEAYSCPSVFDHNILYYDPRVTACGFVSHFPMARMNFNGSVTGDEKTGYYWTSTPALGVTGTGDQAGMWLQFIKFDGFNHSFDRQRTVENSNNTGMSLRLVDDAPENNSIDMLRFRVKGYTHIYLYTIDENGARVGLNSWPGDRITMYADDLSDYFEYNFQTYQSLPSKFYVVLSKITPDLHTVAWWNGTEHSDLSQPDPVHVNGYEQQRDRAMEEFYQYPEVVESKDVTVYFDNASAGWGKVMAYVWDGTMELAPWSNTGGTPTTLYKDKIYKISFNSAYTSIVFNDAGTTKTGDLKVVADHVYTKDGDTGKTISEYTSGETPVDPPVDPDKKKTIYFDLGTKNWTYVNCHYWSTSGADNHTEWPGIRMTKIDRENTNIYTLELDSWAGKLMFDSLEKNGASGQQTDGDGWEVKDNHVYTFDGDTGKTYDAYTPIKVEEEKPTEYDAPLGYDIYMRGYGDWAANDNNRFQWDRLNNYYWLDITTSGSFEFKVADDSWSHQWTFASSDIDTKNKLYSVGGNDNSKLTLTGNLRVYLYYTANTFQLEVKSR